MGSEKNILFKKFEKRAKKGGKRYNFNNKQRAIKIKRPTLYENNKSRVFNVKNNINAIRCESEYGYNIIYILKQPN